MKTLIRVAVNNNFNCTKREFDQLNDISSSDPHSTFFINTNIKTPGLSRIKNYSYKTVITVNPDITVNPELIKKLKRLPVDKIAFIRIKYIPNNIPIIKLIKDLSKNYKIVITVQRFNSKKSIKPFVPNFRKEYTFKNNRYRLNPKGYDLLESIIEKLNNVYICDKLQQGCSSCKLCSTLVTGKDYPIYTLNLSSSGICPYSCVDCYAKTLQNFLIKINKSAIRYDYIHMNKKQAKKPKIKDINRKVG
jgi:hypothetical protein